MLPISPTNFQQLFPKNFTGLLLHLHSFKFSQHSIPAKVFLLSSCLLSHKLTPSSSERKCICEGWGDVGIKLMPNILATALIFANDITTTLKEAKRDGYSMFNCKQLC